MERCTLVVQKNNLIREIGVATESASGIEARESLAYDRASGAALRVAPQVQDVAQLLEEAKLERSIL